MAVDRRREDSSGPTLVPELGALGTRRGSFHSGCTESDGICRRRDQATLACIHALRVSRRAVFFRHVRDVWILRRPPRALELFQDSARADGRWRGVYSLGSTVSNRLEDK